MNLTPSVIWDTIGLSLGFILSLFVFSYIFRDNVLFRLAMHLFIGVAAGYAAVAVWYSVLWPQLFQPIHRLGRDWQGWLLLIVPWILSLLLLTKTTKRFSHLGTPSLAFLLGVGMAAAVGGAITGTVIPQIRAAIAAFDSSNHSLLINNQYSGGFNSGFPMTGYLNAGVMLLATISTLVYFQFNRKETNLESQEEVGWLDGIVWIGKLSIVVALGVVFAGVLTASFTALVERVDFILTNILMLF